MKDALKTNVIFMRENIEAFAAILAGIISFRIVNEILQTGVLAVGFLAGVHSLYTQIRRYMDRRKKPPVLLIVFFVLASFGANAQGGFGAVTYTPDFYVSINRQQTGGTATSINAYFRLNIPANRRVAIVSIQGFMNPATATNTPLNQAVSYLFVTLPPTVQKTAIDTLTVPSPTYPLFQGGFYIPIPERGNLWTGFIPIQRKALLNNDDFFWQSGAVITGSEINSTVVTIGFVYTDIPGTPAYRANY